MSGILWFEPEGTWHCSRCPAVIGGDGNPAAWLPDGDDGEVICCDCGDQLENAAAPAVPG